MRYHVCRRMKALYGMIHAPQAWYFKINEFLLKLGCSKICADFHLLLFYRPNPLFLGL